MDYLDELEQKFSEAGADDRASLLLAAKEFITAKREDVHRMHFDGASGAAVVARYTALADALVKAIYSIGGKAGTMRSAHAIIALGGYGREELCFSSDLDIMVLHEGRLNQELEALNDYLLHFLWDLDFRVGHSIRSISQSLKIAKLDDTVRTSMLESRILAGNASTFDKFTKKLFAQLNSGGAKRFIRKKEKERGRSYREAGDDIFHPEPNIKNTAGGLRDYHTGVWIALARYRLKTPRDLLNAGLLREEQFLRLRRALDFMWRVRNQIHFEQGSPEDLLTPQRQEHIAHEFGYRASRGALAVELFMQDYYIHASELHRFYQEMLRLGGLPKRRRRKDDVARGAKVERGLRIAGRQVYVPSGDENWFRENPARLLEVIWYSQKQGFTLSSNTIWKMKANLDLIDDQFRRSPVARDYFMAILSDLKRVGSNARQMNDIGILDRFLPEFAAIKDVVRYHTFHQHPVNEHTLRALENLSAIPHLEELGTDALKQILLEVKTPGLLSLAILLHDLGKGEEGSHVEKGIHIAEAVGKRLGLNQKQMSALVFLIRNHLEMTHLSQYRDLDDPEIIRSFASEVGTQENLNLLYLLTFADLYAVRHGEWNDWKSALLYQLYSRTRQVLEDPSIAEQEHSEHWNTPKARAICEFLPKKDSNLVKKHLKLMSPRYSAIFSPEDIAGHMRMIASLRKRKTALKCAPLRNYSLSQITICAKDRPGLFAEIAGAFASQQVSVLGAAIFTRSDGVAIDSFYVVDGETDSSLEETKWDIVKECLRKVLRGERDVATLIRHAERSPRVFQRTMSSLRRRVRFDNGVSATHTVIDIEAPDRIGLLYDIASTLFGLGLNISVARVATDVRQARDAFYVDDGAGGKITDPLRIEEIKKRIEEVLEPDRKPSAAGDDKGEKLHLIDNDGEMKTEKESLKT